jgi:hypothetical protein
MRHRAATLFTAHTGRPKGRWLGRAAYSADLTAGRLGRVGDEIVRHAEIPFPGLRMSRCRPNGFACSRPIQVLSASAGDRICRWTVEVASTPLMATTTARAIPSRPTRRRTCAYPPTTRATDTTQLHRGFHGVGAACHGELAVADGFLAGGAYGERVEVGAAGVLEDDRFGAGVDVPVTPFFECQEDGLKVSPGVSQQVFVAWRML